MLFSFNTNKRKIATHINSILLFLLIVLFSIGSCNQKEQKEEYVLKIRLKDDVDCLNPIVSQSAVATQIEALIMVPMIEYHAHKLELSPLLVKSVPQIIGSNDSSTIFACELLEEAKWDDGSPVLASDYSFTLKAALNPYIKNTSWRSFLKNLRAIQFDPAKPKAMEIHVAKNYMLGPEVSGNLNVYQESVYDSAKVMRNFSAADLIYKDSAAWTPQEHALLKSFADRFQSAEFCKSTISGAGPYRIKSWDAGSRIVLEKKNNWWGSPLKDKDLMLEAKPDLIEYLIMPDEAATILALKEGSVDIATDISPRQFKSLKEDSIYRDKLSFHTVGFFKYSILELNTRNAGLDDVNVRKALAHICDLNTYINNLMEGFADPVTGPIHPLKYYYNKNLKSPEFDPKRAKSLLEQAGWSDSDRNGLLDKQLNGRKTQLSFRILTSGAVSSRIGLLLKAEAEKIGIEIIPETKETALFIKDINERNFDIAAVTVTQQATSLYDPFQIYHSSQSKPGGGNRSGLHSPEVDSCINIIRNSTSDTERTQAYMRFQSLLSDYQCQIFLFSPQERIIANRRIDMKTIARRPGYLENSLDLKKD